MCRGANEALGVASLEEAAADDSYSQRVRAPHMRRQKPTVGRDELVLQDYPSFSRVCVLSPLLVLRDGTIARK